MSDQTTLLTLPYILPSQAQKHVTHNESLRLLDAIVQLSVASRNLTTPPADPAEGERHIVAADAGAAWSGKDGQVAAFQDGAWAFLQPRTGWLAWVDTEQRLFCRAGGSWTAAEGFISTLQNLALLGIGTTADAANPFAAKLNKALWSARYASEGGDGDLRYTLNKEASGNTASLLMQSNWSGRAEIGLAGDDDLRVKVSADGSAWKDGLVVDRATGQLAVQGLQSIPANRASASSVIFTPGGDGTISLYRLNTTSGQNPRTATIASISGSRITLSAAVADTIFATIMTGVAFARIWNTTLSADGHSAWARAYADASSLDVTDAADIAAWSPGDTIQVGDPLSVTPNRCITLDISPMLVNLFGQAFRQSGLIAKASFMGGSGSDSLGLSPTGENGSFVSAAVNGAGDGVTLIPCTELSPLSNSNLVRIRETVATTAGIRLVSCLAVLG
jgi:hypothetical protein